MTDELLQDGEWASKLARAALIRAELAKLAGLRRELRRQLAELEPEDQADETAMVFADWVCEAEYPLERLRAVVAELERDERGHGRDVLPRGHVLILPLLEPRIEVTGLNVSRMWGRYDRLDPDRMGRLVDFEDQGGGEFTATLTDKKVVDELMSAFRAGMFMTIYDREAPQHPMQIVLHTIQVDSEAFNFTDHPRRLRRLTSYRIAGHIARWPERVGEAHFNRSPGEPEAYAPEEED